MSRSGVEVVASRGCARLLLQGMHQPSSAASVASSSAAGPGAGAGARADGDGPFAGLVICVTGLSKEARAQVKEATERLGGEYSGSLHPKCTHLVVQSFAGRKFEHALKHGPRNGLFVVTLSWFVDCVRRNMRLDESLYNIKNIGENGLPLGEFNRLVGVPVSEKSCLPPMIFQDKAYLDTTRKHALQTPRKEGGRDEFVFMNDTIYMDPGISGEMRKKNRKLGNVPSINRNSNGPPSTQGEIDEVHQERQKFVEVAKKEVRDRRTHRMQSCEVPIHPITPATLLDSICWTISEPTSSTSIYTDSSWSDDVNEQQSTTYFDANGGMRDPDQPTDNFSRPLRESEQSELIFKNHFLTILFPIDRFGELGPSSRTFYSNSGFTRIQVLDHIYNFYQENMSTDEINVALHTDSRHADRLRSLYAGAASAEKGFVTFKRIDFLGSRRSFEALKRLNRENNSNVYDLVIRA